MRAFTTQEVIDMGADLYDNKGFTRQNIWKWITALNESNLICEKLDSEAIDRIFDLIVG